MTRFFGHILWLILISTTFRTFSQDITGTWEGRMGDEFLQVNIVQKNNELCGFTYDYRLDNPDDHCKARFKGFYSTSESAWIIRGNSFIENSGSHVLMKLILWSEEEGKITRLKGILLDRPEARFILQKKASVPMKSILPECFPPPKPPANEENAVAPKKKVTPPVTRTPVTKKPVPKKQPSQKPTPRFEQTKPVLKKAKEAITQPDKKPVPVPRVAENSQLVKKMSARKKTEMSRLQVNVKHLTLKVYDNGIVDNDTVTIFYNKTILVRKQKLSEKPLVLNIELDEKASLHEITMYADNLGSIPPNTALVVVTAGDKRYELHSSASLEENAVLVFEYKP
jgi:hypothetical protein